MTETLEDSIFEQLVRAHLEPMTVEYVYHHHDPGHDDGHDDHGHDGDDHNGDRDPSPESAPGSGWFAPGTDEPRDAQGVSPEIAAVQGSVTALAAAPVSGRPVDVAALLQAAERLRGLALRGLAEMDATGSHLAAGSVTAATWLRDTQVISDVSARAKVRLATTLRDELPKVAQQLIDGATTVEHAAAAVAGTRGLDPHLVADSEEAICGLLAAADPQTVREQLRDRAEAINPELGRDAERRAHARRGFTADPVANGVVLGGSAGVEDGAILLHALDRAVEADRTDGDTRSLRQRRLDVLVQWARQHGGPAGSVAEDLRTTRTHLLLSCTLEQLEAARRFLADIGQPPAGAARPGSADDLIGASWPWGPVASTRSAQPDSSRIPAGGSFAPDALVSTDTLRRLVCDAALSLVVHPDLQPKAADGPAGTDPLGLRPEVGGTRTDPLYVGRAARIITAAQWRALVVRDRRCVVKGCRRRPAQCEGHHVRHWLDGGRTDLDNLVLLCFQHHHEHHDQHHDLQHRDGRWITSSGWAHAPP